MVNNGGKWSQIDKRWNMNGEYHISLDDKGRIRIPKNFISEFGKYCYIGKGIDECLWLFSEEEWDEFEEKVNNGNAVNKNFRRIQRHLIGSSVKQEIDRQSRANIPNSLIDYAKLDKECVVIGIGKKIEIWSKEVYDATQTDLDDISELIQNSGLEI